MKSGRSKDLVALLATCGALGLGSFLLLRARGALGEEWTDGARRFASASGADVRHAVWDAPQRLDALGEVRDPALSPDGRLLVFASGERGLNVELFAAELVDGEPREPRPLVALNSPADELAPAFADGDFEQQSVGLEPTAPWRVFRGNSSVVSSAPEEPDFTAAGMDVVLFGPLPTPAVAMLTRSLRADLGVMLSASHNKFADNGIKLFGPDGYKLSDAAELEIEQLMDAPLDTHLSAPDKLGRARRIDDAQARYVEIVKATFPKKLTLKGLRIVIDAANGAAYKVAPVALYELGAEVIKIGVDPDGFNINEEVGSTDTRALKDAVRKYRADLGIALDGDADRVAIIDEKGNAIDGDGCDGVSHSGGRGCGGGIRIHCAARGGPGSVSIDSTHRSRPAHGLDRQELEGQWHAYQTRHRRHGDEQPRP